MTAEAGEEYDKSLKSQAIPIFEKELPLPDGWGFFNMDRTAAGFLFPSSHHNGFL